jgi:3-phenylpropionate/trans-cinnamate dioxygenase ferredoxin subunit
MKHALGPVEDFPAGGIKTFEVGGRSVGVVNAGDTLYGVLNVCPHALAPVCEGRLVGTMLPSAQGEAIWGMDGRILRCPWHGFEFDLANGGQTVFTTFKARVRMFGVSVEDGIVHIDLPDRPAVPAPAEPAGASGT